jgi:hypothetical protein
MRHFSALLLLALAFSCTSPRERTPQSVSDAQLGEVRINYLNVPSSEQLFLTGKFLVKKKFWKLLDEDHYGEEMDLSMRRPVVNLAGTVFETKYGRPGHKLFANFYHEGSFHIVLVPDQAVQRVLFQLSYFPPQIGGKYVAAHSLLRFELARPLQIVAPMPNESELQRLIAAVPAERLALLPVAEQPVAIGNVAISAEAQWSQSDPERAYDLRRGKNGAFIQIVRFMSISERFKEFYGSGNPVSQIVLETGKGDGILAAALSMSQSDGLRKLYDTFWYNCTTIAFDMVERGSGRRDRRLGLIRRFMGRRIPITAPRKLEEYGGLEALPINMDPSLLDESYIGHQAVIQGPGRAECPDSMDAPNCKNIKQAVKTLQAGGRLP